MSRPSSEPMISQTTAEELAKLFGDRGDYVVRAGAGAGKTTELVSRVLGLAVRFKTEKGRWPHLVVTTFTRKATQELRERLLQKALQTKNSELIDYVQRPSLLHISTIHGVLAMFLSQAGSHLGMNPRFQWMDNSAEVRVLKKILRQILQEEGPDLASLLDEVNLRGLIPALQQAYHLRAEKGKALVSVSLAELQVVPQKMAHEWLEQALDFLACAEGITSLTKSKAWPDYQALLQLTCQRLQESPEAFQEHLFYFDENKPTIKLTGEAEPLGEKRDWLQKTAKDLAHNWAHSQEAMIRHEEMAKAFERLSEKIFQELWQHKVQQSSLTMSDLETVALGLCHSHPEAAVDFSKLWDYWMVDEYQDTSPRQVELLRHLQGDRESFTVGDPQQSIYLFRGARAEVFQQKEELAKRQGGQLLRKMTNYRSQPELLKFLNHFFAEMGGQFSKMELDPGKPLRGTAPAVAEYFECGEEVSLTTMIIRRCREWIEAGVPAEQICVLARANKTLQELAEEAGKQGVAVQVHAASRFYERREVQDALSLLKFLCNPHDNRNLMILLRSPWFRIPDSVLVRALANLVGESHWLTLLKNCSDPVLLKLQDLRKQADAMGLRMAWEQGLQRSGLLDLASMVDPTGRREANLWKLICLLREEERRPGFRFLDFAEKAEPTTADIEDGGDADATPVELPQRVNLMTVHASKGLQFRHVILASMGSFRSRRKSSFFLFHESQEKFSLGLRDPETDSLKMMAWAEEWQDEFKKREQQEYDRVLYVALTRAQDSVALFWEKPEKGSWAQRMWRPVPGDTETEGFRTRYQVIEKEEDLPVKKIAPASAPVLLKPWLSPARVRVGQLSVSDILEAKVQKSHTVMGSPDERIEQALRGVSVHRWLESLRYQALPKRPEDRKWIQYIESWQDGRLLKWIKTGEVEWGFCVALQLPDRQEWIQGQIDLWARDQDQIWVIDYKTGSEKQKRKAFDQLDIYAWALQQTPHARGLECHLAVVYPHTENVYTEKATPVAEMTKKLQDLLQSRTEIK